MKKTAVTNNIFQKGPFTASRQGKQICHILYIVEKILLSIHFLSGVLQLN